MRYANVILITVLTFVFAFAGCSRGATKSKIDTKNLEASFVSAEPALKVAVEKAVAAIKSEDYETAARLLESLLHGKQITQEQSQAIRGVLDALPAYPRLAP